MEGRHRLCRGIVASMNIRQLSTSVYAERYVAYTTQGVC
jgi:hypothetical protein